MTLRNCKNCLATLKQCQAGCFANTIQSALQPMRVLIERDWIEFREPKFHLGQLVRTPCGPGTITGLTYSLESNDWNYHCDPHPANEEWLSHCEDRIFQGRELQSATRTEIDRLVLLSPELQAIADQISNRFSTNGHDAEAVTNWATVKRC